MNILLSSYGISIDCACVCEGLENTRGLEALFLGGDEALESFVWGVEKSEDLGQERCRGRYRWRSLEPSSQVRQGWQPWMEHIGLFSFSCRPLICSMGHLPVFWSAISYVEKGVGDVVWFTTDWK